MSEEIGEFLDQASRDGRFDSTGVFTIDWARAKLKLAKHQMADPGMFLLKLIQAMVHWGCSEIRFREGGILDPEGLEMYCGFGSDAVLSLEKLRAALLQDPLQITEEALRDFLAGLATALSLGEVGVAYRGESAWVLSDHPRLISRTSGTGYVLLFDSFFPDQRLKELVHQRCRFAPIPIFWNQQRVAHQTYPWDSYSRLLERFHAGSGLGLCMHGLPLVSAASRKAPISPIPSLYCRQVVDGSGQARPTQGPQGEVKSCSSILCMSLPLQDSSELWPVRFGVTLAPLVLGDYCGCRVVLNADQVPVDLSGFKARQGVELDQLRGRAAREIREGAKFLLDEIPPKAFQRPGNYLLDLTARVAMGALGVVTAFPKPIVGIPLILLAFRKRTSEPDSESQADTDRIRAGLQAILNFRALEEV